MNAPTNVKQYLSTSTLRGKFSRSGSYSIPFLEFISFCKSNDFLLEQTSLIDYPYKQIMERVAKGEVIAIPNAGVKVYDLIYPIRRIFNEY